MKRAVDFVVALANRNHAVSHLYHSFLRRFPSLISLYYKGKEYEEETTDLLRTLLRRNDIFVDVGANVGHYTLLASKLCSEVYAIEPAPENFRLLKDMVERNGLKNVTCLPYAAWSKDGTMPLYLHKEAGRHSITQRSEKSVDVKAIALDNLLSSKTSIVLKADVEGGELHVIRGVKKALDEGRIRFMVLEFNDGMLTSEVSRLSLATYEAIGAVFAIESEVPRRIREFGALPSSCNLLVVPRRS